MSDNFKITEPGFYRLSTGDKIEIVDRHPFESSWWRSAPISKLFLILYQENGEPVFPIIAKWEEPRIDLKEFSLRTSTREEGSCDIAAGISDTDPDFPNGAIHNGRAFMERLEMSMDTEMLNSEEWREIKFNFNYMAEYLEAIGDRNWKRDALYYEACLKNLHAECSIYYEETSAPDASEARDFLESVILHKYQPEGIDLTKPNYGMF